MSSAKGLVFAEVAPFVGAGVHHCVMGTRWGWAAGAASAGTARLAAGGPNESQSRSIRSAGFATGAALASQPLRAKGLPEAWLRAGSGLLWHGWPSDGCEGRSCRCGAAAALG